ncbi:2-pyrone-4,6-dicarboxylate hydrolase-like isoform X1 [Zingiber officinale]|uniref:2-pyrone-4,6-dicarboxylate hydrolase-like isoform X1 n=1 Tax=Zingiber officinale TaxID=94328 RepID=UPI001C4CEBAB|nr:2-pyrone-4,6-dicarboxylate hydrolase-like isoform X1 [Zingiber officinale]
MLLAASPSPFVLFLSHKRTLPVAVRMAASNAEAIPSPSSCPPPKILDSHLHVWASPKEAAENYPYFPGQEPSVPGDADFLLKCMSEAGVDGALIVQPINHMFDHSLVTSVLRRHPSKFVGCCLANPADDGSGIRQLEDLVLKDGYRAVRFNPYLWPPGQKMTNEIGKALFSKAGELGVPVGFMCMKVDQYLGLSLHISEIEELCESYSSTVVLLDHMGFCKPPLTDEERYALSSLLKLSRFPQVYVKFSALFRLSRNQYPYEDTRDILSKVISSFGANHVMWGSDFPFVVKECGYREAKEAVPLIANRIPLSSADMEWIMGRTLGQLFHREWQA